MKIRNGFVSNSSSSSFIVAFPRRPKSVKDVIKMVFGKAKFFKNPYVWQGRPDKFPVEDVAKIIWRDIEKQIPNNKNRFISRMGNLLDYNDYVIKDKDTKYTEWDNDALDFDTRVMIEKFMSSNSDSYVYFLECSDNSGGAIGSAMEHGNLFKRLPHLVSSNH